MKNVEAKVSFKLTKDGKATVQLHGSSMTVKTGLLTIIERLAELEERSVLSLLSELTKEAKMKEETPIGAILMGILGDIFGEGTDEEICDGDCGNYLDRMFGGKK